jgi:hypothetical protein
MLSANNLTRLSRVALFRRWNADSFLRFSVRAGSFFGLFGFCPQEVFAKARTKNIIIGKRLILNWHTTEQSLRSMDI